MLRTNLLFALCIIFFLLIGNVVCAQISGISGNKINSIHYKPIPLKSVEFEPTLSSLFAKGYWHKSNPPVDTLQGILVNSNINWRMTYGLNNRTELGLSATNDLSSINLAGKILLANSNKLKLSAMLGYGINLGNEQFNNTNNKHLSYSLLGYGIIWSFDLGPKNQLDINLQVQQGFNNQNPTQFFVHADFGSYFLKDDLFLLMAASYQQNISTELNSNKFTIYPGLALETGQQFAFGLYSQHDLFGRNASKTWGLNIVLTMVLL